jgi:DNA-binding NarL/FixJ family response regulator/signal transduction histidine kinase
LTGAVVALVLLIAVPMALVFLAPRVGLGAGVVTGLRVGPLDKGDTWWWSLIGLILLVGTVYAVAGLGALAALMAPVLLGPSQAERIAVLEAGSRRLAERNRIARDLHDSIGHALTATTLQAAAAREVFDTDPAFVRRALETIEEVGRAAMDDLDHVLGVLRDREPGQDRDGTGDAAARRPQPTLDDLPRLCEDARASGVEVSVHVAGSLDAVPAAVSREGYRIVQEGLTNAARHAGRVPVTLRMAVAEGALAIDITNPVTNRATGRRRGGRGLDGMRERVELLGGRSVVCRGHAAIGWSGPVGRSGMTTTVLIVDDDELVRVGLRAIIDAQPDLRVVGEAADGAEVLSSVRRLRPDVVLMDVRMPAIDGIQATRHLLSVVNDPPRILVITTFENDEYVYAALRAGASGFLLKRARPGEVVDAVRVIARGDSLLFPAAIRRLAARYGHADAAGRLPGARLTGRELDVLRLMAAGRSNAEIAAALVVGVETVKTHVGNVLTKLGVRDRTQAVIVAYESGFVTSAG